MDLYGVLILLPVYVIIKVIFMLYIFSRIFGKHENVIGTKISTFTVVYLGKPEKIMYKLPWKYNMY